MPITVGLIDDQTLVRQGIRGLLELSDRVAVEKADPQPIFDKLDLPVDRRGRDPGRARGRLDRPMVGDGLDIVQRAGDKVQLHRHAS